MYSARGIMRFVCQQHCSRYYTVSIMLVWTNSSLKSLQCLATIGTQLKLCVSRLNPTARARSRHADAMWFVRLLICALPLLLPLPWPMLIAHPPTANRSGPCTAGVRVLPCRRYPRQPPKHLQPAWRLCIPAVRPHHYRNPGIHHQADPCPG